MSFEGGSTSDLLVTSPLDLEQDTNYYFELSVTETIAGDQYCSDKDTIIVTVRENICPIADAGNDVRIPKFNNTNVLLNANRSSDPDGGDLEFSWVSPGGEIINNSEIVISDLSPERKL